ncbi:class I adenylate-forming enzyme family protein [Terasakiella pusilla]|jgi:acyl-CoA synthetase (AMP-forming)/AMP-acid ligase II|uniref:class I adenylate-forming enzyme family protein n=1 Tax=Terasakiella pusilla TaxID=64973 RepID=UPI003AA8F6B2
MIAGDEILTGKTAQEIFEALPERVSHKVKNNINTSPDKLALVEAAGAWTYAELGQAIEEAKSYLQDKGVVPGDRLMLVLENCRAGVAFLLAASELNVWAALVNARMMTGELQAIIDDCDPRLVLFFTAVSPEATNHADKLGAVSQDVLSLGTFSLLARTGGEPEVVEEKGSAQVCAMIYTSGTTGKPKGVMLTHRNVAFIGAVSGAMRGLSADDVVYAVLPISHAFGLCSTCMGGLFAGATIYLEPRFEVRKCLSALRDWDVTVFQGVPPMYSVMIEALKSDEFDLADLKLRYISVGGAPLDPETKEKTEHFFGMPLHNGYGLTETSPTISQARLNEGLKNCSVGRPIPGVEIKIIDGSGNEVAAGETGELWARGPNVMKGYFRNEAETQKVLTADGWFNTQDLARLDEDGNIIIAGRTKEMIVQSGFNVYPAEVEATLNRHPYITQSAVIGVQVPGNEQVHAFVQVHAGADVSVEDIRAYCKEHLTAYKRPSQITILDALPASSTGKILKRKLHDMSADQCEK